MSDCFDDHKMCKGCEMVVIGPINDAQLAQIKNAVGSLNDRTLFFPWHRYSCEYKDGVKVPGTERTVWPAYLKKQLLLGRIDAGPMPGGFVSRLELVYSLFLAEPYTTDYVVGDWSFLSDFEKHPNHDEDMAELAALKRKYA